MVHILETSFHGNPNVGLYLFCTNDYAIIGKGVSQRVVDDIKEVLQVPVHQLDICGTALAGVFLAGNSHCLLVPELIFESELRELEKLKIPYKVIKTKHTALGNNILCNDTGALVSPEFSADTKKEIRKALQVPVKPGTLAGIPTVGSASALNAKGCIVHVDASPKEIQFAQDLLDVEVSAGTVNLGNPYIGSGLACNDHGFVAGKQSSGPELTMIDEYLGFL